MGALAQMEEIGRRLKAKRSEAAGALARMERVGQQLKTQQTAAPVGAVDQAAADPPPAPASAHNQNAAWERSGMDRDSYDSRVRRGYAVRELEQLRQRRDQANEMLNTYANLSVSNQLSKAQAQDAAQQRERFRGEAAELDKRIARMKGELARRGEALDYGQLAQHTLRKGVNSIAGTASGALAFLERNTIGALADTVTANDEYHKELPFYWINEKVKDEGRAIDELNAANQAKYGGSKATEKIYAYGAATLNAIPQAVMAVATAGGSLGIKGLEATSRAAQAAPGIAASIKTVASSVSRDPNYWTAFFSTVGDDYQQALENGATNSAASLYAITAGLLNAGIEIGGGIQGIPKEIQSGGKNAVLAWVEGMLDEGKEEVVQGIISRSLENLTYGKNNPLLSATDSSAILNPSTAADEFAGGAVVGGILGGGQIALGEIANRAAQAVPTAPTRPAISTAGVNTQQRAEAQQRGPEAAVGFKVDSREVVSKLQASIPALQSEPAAATLKGTEFPKGAKKLTEQVGDFFRSLGNSVFRRGLGDVILDERGVKSDIAHGIGRAKSITFAAVPDVIAKGRQIDYQKNWKWRGYDTYIFAAPVDLAGQTSYVAAVVRSDVSNRFYLHEVVDGDGNLIYKIDAPTAIKTGVTAESGVTGAVEAPDPSLAQSASGVNTVYTENGGNITENGVDSNGTTETVRLRRSGQRSDGADPGGQIRGVEESAGRDQGRQAQGRPADSAAANLTYGKTVSTGALGIGAGSQTDAVHLLTGGETEAIRSAKALARERGLRPIFFGGGNLTIQKESVRGYVTGDRVFVRVDHPDFTADQIMRHEVGHYRIAKGEINPDQVRGRLDRMGGEQLRRDIAALYAEAFEGSGLSEAEIWEEIICDSLGDMNIFNSVRMAGDTMDRFLDAVWEDAGGRGAREASGVGTDGSQRQSREAPNLQAMIEKYGAIQPGERPARKVQVPRRTADNNRVSQTVRTVLEAGATPEEAVPTIENLVAKGDFSYNVYTDKAALSDAEGYIRRKGWAEALTDWRKEVERGEVSKKNTAVGWALYNNAANSGDTETALAILNDMIRHQRSAAQAVQATRILKKLSPETQLYQVRRSVERLQEELNKRYGDKGGPELEIDPELAGRFMEAGDQSARDAILKDIYRDIGRQMPSRFADKWNAWRYLSMLGNPRTHVRNIVGNAGFAPVVAAKDLSATAIEAAVSRISGGKLNQPPPLRRRPGPILQGPQHHGLGGGRMEGTGYPRSPGLRHPGGPEGHLPGHQRLIPGHQRAGAKRINEQKPR